MVPKCAADARRLRATSLSLPPVAQDVVSEIMNGAHARAWLALAHLLSIMPSTDAFYPREGMVAAAMPSAVVFCRSHTHTKQRTEWSQTGNSQGVRNNYGQRRPLGPNGGLSERCYLLRHAEAREHLPSGRRKSRPSAEENAKFKSAA